MALLMKLSAPSERLFAESFYFYFLKDSSSEKIEIPQHIIRSVPFIRWLHGVSTADLDKSGLSCRSYFNSLHFRGRAALIRGLLTVSKPAFFVSTFEVSRFHSLTFPPLQTNRASNLLTVDFLRTFLSGSSASGKKQKLSLHMDVVFPVIIEYSLSSVAQDRFYALQALEFWIRLAEDALRFAYSGLGTPASTATGHKETKQGLQGAKSLATPMDAASASSLRTRVESCLKEIAEITNSNWSHPMRAITNVSQAIFDTFIRVTDFCSEKKHQRSDWTPFLTSLLHNNREALSLGSLSCLSSILPSMGGLKMIKSFPDLIPRLFASAESRPVWSMASKFLETLLAHAKKEVSSCAFSLNC